MYSSRVGFIPHYNALSEVVCVFKFVRARVFMSKNFLCKDIFINKFSTRFICFYVITFFSVLKVNKTLTDALADKECCVPLSVIV